MRGEDSNAVVSNGRVKGSPPHARGRLDNATKEFDVHRITPACAGKTLTVGAF